MSESKFEKVSSLVDNYQNNEGHSAELFEQLNTDSVLSDTWSHYHLIGDVLRDELPSKISLDFSTQIAQAIADEPTVLAPKKLTLFNVVKAKVVQFSKPFGQVAIAASAAGLMILGVQQNVAQNEIVMPSQVFQTTPLAGFAAPVSFNTQSANRLSQKQIYIEQQRRFQALLSDHHQQVKLSASKNSNQILSTLEVEDSAK
ncbi:MAG: sigma-E factor negative regulatory protein RseA [Alteromonadaceae bacterium]|mgnify:FL=1|jgi:sigma-E factor negative regulatory protein RseA|tara:strand:+ start:709 stop:1311 length:603 start_codon:yes stop_codon:yes gene_type:complete